MTQPNTNLAMKNQKMKKKNPDWEEASLKEQLAFWWKWQKIK
jgi:hypothetical protein